MRRRRVHRGSRLRRLQIVMRLSRRRLVRHLIVRRRALLLLALLGRTLLGLALGLLAGRASWQIVRGVLIIHCGSPYRCSQVVV